VKEKRSIIHTIKRRTCNWDGHILQRNCLVEHDIEGKIEERIKVTGGRGGRRKETRDKLKKMRGYLELREEALDHTCGELVLEEAMDRMRMDNCIIMCHVGRILICASF
jgi:hypothetical protein